MKNVLILTLITFSTNVFSADMNDINARLMASFKNALKTFSEIQTTVSAKAPPCQLEEKAIPPLDPAFKSRNAVCDNFISSNDDGGYGPWGEVVIEYLKQEGNDSPFFNNNITNMDEVCPNWKNTTREQKEYSWVWTIASISQIESTCKPSERSDKEGANGVGVPVGLLQLEERISTRAWRGPNCRVKSIVPPDNNLRCGLDIMKELLKGKNGLYKSNGAIYGRGASSYWNHLRRPDGGGIVDFMQLNPFCKK